MLEQIKYVSAIRYFSSHWAYHLSRRVQKVEKNWMIWLTGAIDPKVIIAFLILIGLGAVMFLFMQFYSPQAMLGPMPEG